VLPDEARVLGSEGRVAEHVVGMHVRVDHVADRKRGPGSHRSEQPAAGSQATAGVDDRHRLAPDDKADIGDRPLVRGTGERIGRLIDEDPISDLADR
jgi:hypothetical protein